MDIRNRKKPPLLTASPKYPWRSYSPLRTHDFIEKILTRSSPPLRVFICRSCDRRFKFDAEGHMTWAVASDKKSSALQAELNRRWLSEPCAGRPDTNEADFKRVRGALAG